MYPRRFGVLMMCFAVVSIRASAWAQSPPPPAMPLPMLSDPGTILEAAAPPQTRREASPFLGLVSPPRVEQPTGAAVTSIAVDVPPGRGGMTPAVAVLYSSNRGSGLFGLGWDLPVGCIKRSTRSGVPFAYLDDPLDPFHYPVPGDGFSGDGDYILEIDGSQIRLDRYLGQNGSYHAFGSSTEEHFLRVWFDPNANVWVVTSKAGVRFTYGQGGAETRAGFDVSSAAGTFAWGLTRVEDPNGNRIDYTYASHGLLLPQNRALYPSGIEWGENTNAGHSHLFRVEIQYEDRPDHPVSYTGGYEDVMSKRASRIAVLFLERSIRTYDFVYEDEPLTGVSRLVEVTSSAFSLDEPPARIDLPPAKFEYGRVPRGFGEPVTIPFASATTRFVHDFYDGTIPEKEMMDLDGDARPDRLETLTSMRIHRNRGNGFAAASQQQPPFAGYFVRQPWMAHLDLDGDFLVDAVDASCAADGPCYWKVLFDLAGSAEYRDDWYSPPIYDAPFSAGFFDAPDLRLRTLDLNGDRRPDRFVCPFVAGAPASGEACFTFLNTGSGFSDQPLPWPLPMVATGMPPGEHWQDMNGDGLTDLVVPVDGAPRWEIYLNTGRGFALPEEWTFPGLTEVPLVRSTSGECIQNAYGDKELFDMNGDGRVDYVDSSSGAWQVFFNTGQGFSSPAGWNGTAPFPGAPGNWIEWWEGFDLYGICFYWKTRTDLIDFDGDGIADWVYGRNDSWMVKYGERSRSGEITRVTNGLGAAFEVDYEAATVLRTEGLFCNGGPLDGKPCTAPAECGGGQCTPGADMTDYLPFPTHVVTRLTTYSGFAGPGNNLARSYRYEGGAYDPEQVEIRGFRWIVEQDEQRNRRTETEYAQPADPFDAAARAAVRTLRAKPLRQRVVDAAANRLLLERAFAWQRVAQADGRTRVTLGSRTETSYGDDGISSQTTSFSYAYDSYNNPSILQRRAGPTLVSTQSATYTYDLDRFIVDRPAVINNSGVSSRRFTYDGTGNPIRIEDWLDTNATWLSTTIDYDAAGLPERVVNPRGAATTLTWDCNLGLYPCTITNALGHVTTSAHDLRFGQPVEVTDPNGSRVLYDCDALGRLTAITQTPEIDAEPARRFAYTFGLSPMPSRVDTLVREPGRSSGYRHLSSFFDSLGRPLQSRRTDVVDGASTVLVGDAVKLDAAGRVASRAAPYTTPQPVDFWYPTTNQPATSYEYDAFDRVVRTTNPNGTYRTADFSVAGRVLMRDENATAYDAGARTNVSGSGRRTEERRDELGRLIAVKEYDGALDATGLRVHTEHAYDALDRLVSTTSYDEGGSGFVLRFVYDSLGRRIELDDPDSGTWTYAYDAAGNLVYQDDPKAGQHLELCHDELDRLRCKYGFEDDNWSGTFACPASAPCPEIPGATLLEQYFHDDACANGIGRVCLVEDPSGSTAFDYDLRGRAVRSQKQIDAAGFQKSFTFEHEYDVANRLLRTDYPSVQGTEPLTLAYDEAGRPLWGTFPGISLFWGTQYDRFGRPRQMTYGNQATNTWEYYESGPSRFQLASIRVDRNGSKLQHFKYARYDKAGNLLAVTDPNGYGYSDRSPLDNDWRYVYDGLGRLTEMTPPRHNQWGGGESIFAYDRLGNLVRRGELSLQHATTGPRHQIAASTPPGGGVAYGYDANGSLSQRPDVDGSQGPELDYAVEYDVQGRVVSVTSGSDTAELVYDYSGARVARIANGAPTFYFGRLFEVTGNELTRHIFAGGRRVAQSRVTLHAGSPLLLAQVTHGPRRTLLAELWRDGLRTSPSTYPRYALAMSDAAKLGALLLLVLILVELTPGRVRLSAGRRSPFRRVRRGHVLLVVVVFGLSLTPITCVEPARATGAGGGPARWPSLFHFIHSDHLGSTTLVTCFRPYVEGCPSGIVALYGRYDAYGVTRLFDGTGVPLAPGEEVTDQLYTGQRWEPRLRLYDYRARFYDPMIARFTSIDPARESLLQVASGSPAASTLVAPTVSLSGAAINPYAYVGWSPVSYVDPDGTHPIALYAALVGFGGLAGGIGESLGGGSFATGFVTGAGVVAGGLAVAHGLTGALPATQLLGKLVYGLASTGMAAAWTVQTQGGVGALLSPDGIAVVFTMSQLGMVGATHAAAVGLVTQGIVAEAIFASAGSGLLSWATHSLGSELKVPGFSGVDSSGATSEAGQSPLGIVQQVLQMSVNLPPMSPNIKAASVSPGDGAFGIPAAISPKGRKVITRNPPLGWEPSTFTGIPAPTAGL